jgi:hypothetical protein
MEKMNKHISLFFSIFFMADNAKIGLVRLIYIANVLN